MSVPTRSQRVLLGLCVSVALSVAGAAAPKSSVDNRSRPFVRVRARSKVWNDRRVTMMPGQGSIYQVCTKAIDAAGYRLFKPGIEVAARPDGRKTAFIVPSPLGLQRAVVALNDVPVGDVLEAVEVVSSTSWKAVGATWVLTRTQENAEGQVLLPDEQDERNIPKEMPLRHLSTPQAQVLTRTGMLLPEQLSFQQREALIGIVRRLLVGPGGYAPEAQSLQGVFLELGAEQRPTGEIVVELGIRVPTWDGGLATPLSLIVQGVRLPPASSGPVRFHPRPQLIPLGPQREGPVPDGNRADLPTDKRLDAQVSLRSATVARAIEAAARASNINVFASTQFNYWPVRFTQSRNTARDLLQHAARTAGGTWRRVGNIYVLRPDPDLERLVSVPVEVRRRWLLAAAERLQGSLTARQLGILRKLTRLEPEELSERQRTQMKWLAKVAFVNRAAIVIDALNLKGVAIVYSPSADRGAGGRVSYQFPTGAGTTISAASIALRN